MGVEPTNQQTSSSDDGHCTRTRNTPENDSLQLFRRVSENVVWDSYIASSIKESTREKRGKGVWSKVGGPTKVPSNWPDFLRDPTNKEELFQFLSDKVGSNDWPDGKEVFIISGTDVISRGSDRSMP
ncbi:hypothetical protein GWK47_011813 [Chionoecetes opilio]|uniref:Uncharacterized protein n=1 Tax=Chionoecetes opilio TaxID=41210 RepID=A0A8J4XVK4_CHIOP|nr:hypothetical protein GWK47_011813 [Chionoecetes opilio]